MKTTLPHLPDYAEQDLQQLAGLVLQALPQTEMIILYGSYAKGSYVSYDRRVEFGIPTSYKSDYDILVVTSGIDSDEAADILDEVDSQYYKDPEQQVPVEFINEDIEKLNSDLSEGRYFYTDIKNEGILLYDKGTYSLSDARRLTDREICEQAQEYFQVKFEYADAFLQNARFDYKEERYTMAAFHLHQACMNYFYAFHLVCTLRNDKQHDLAKLLSSATFLEASFRQIFPRQTVEEKRLFNLLRKAYIEARYNAGFLVGREDTECLLSKTEILRGTTESLCQERIETYRKRVAAARNKPAFPDE